MDRWSEMDRCSEDKGGMQYKRRTDGQKLVQLTELCNQCVYCGGLSVFTTPPPYPPPLSLVSRFVSTGQFNWLETLCPIVGSDGQMDTNNWTETGGQQVRNPCPLVCTGGLSGWTEKQNRWFSTP